MNIQHNQAPNGRHYIEIVTEPAEYGEVEKELYKKYRNSFNIPGFRKGRAPLRLAKQRYGEDFLAEEVADIVAQSALDAMEQERPLEKPGNTDYAIQEIQMEEDGLHVLLTYLGRVIPKLTEEILLVDPDFLEDEVSEEEIDAEIEKQRQEFLDYAPSAEPIQVGDRIVYDLHAYIDRDDHTDVLISNNHVVDVVGQGELHPDYLVAFLEGLEPGEYSFSREKDGETQLYNIKIHSVERGTPLELDDTLVEKILPEDVLEEKTMQAYREFIRTILEEEKQRYNQSRVVESLLSQIVENSEVALDETYLKDFIDNASTEELVQMFVANKAKYFNDVAVRKLLLKEEESEEGLAALREYLKQRYIIDELERVLDLELSPYDYVRLLENNAKNELTLNALPGFFDPENIEDYSQVREQVLRDLSQDDRLYDKLYERTALNHIEGKNAYTLGELLEIEMGEDLAD